MGAQEVLRLLIDADVHGAVSGLKKVGDTTTKELGRSQATIDKWGKGFSKAGIGMVGFGAVAIAGLGAMAKRSEEANLATVKLQNSLAANPRLAGTSAKGFIDLAQAIQSKTAADGDDIVAGMAVLAQGRLQANQIKALTPLVVDLARKKGIDEVAAFTLASKAVQGNAGALKRAGIAVDETKFKTDAYGATMDALKTSVGGFAQEEGKTFQGSLTRMKNQLGDLEEGVGKGAVDAFTSLFGVVGKVSVGLESISPGAQAAAGKIATFGAVGLVAAGGVSMLIGQVIKARQNFSALASGVSDIAGGLGRLKGNFLVAGSSIAVLVAGLEAIDHFMPIEHANMSKLENSLLKLGQSGKASGEVAALAGQNFGKLADAVDRVAKPGVVDRANDVISSITSLGGALPKGTESLDKAKAAIDDVDKALASLAQRDPKAAAATFDTLTAALEKQGIPAARIKQLFNDYSNALADVDTSKATSGANDLGTAMDEQATATEKATAAVDAYHQKINDLFDPLLAYRDALKENSQAQGDVDVKTMEAAAAQAAYTDAVAKHGPHSKEAAAAAMEYTAAVAAQKDAQDHTVDSALHLDSTMADLRAEIQRNPKAASEAKAKLADLARQHIITGAQATAAAHQIDGFVASVNKQPAHKSTKVDVTGDKAAQIKIAALQAQLAGLHNKSVFVDLHVTGAAAVQRAEAKLLGPGHAAGGQVKAGVPGIVGELGPELFIPSTNGTIIPNNKLGMASGGMTATGMTYVTTINVGKVVANDPKQLVEALRKQTRHNGPLPMAVTGRAV